MTQENNEIREEFADHPEIISLKKKLPGMSKDVMKKTTDTIRTEISQLTSKISQLKKTREEHNANARHFRAMRDNVSDERSIEINQIRDKISNTNFLEFRKSIKNINVDELNEQIKLKIDDSQLSRQEKDYAKQFVASINLSKMLKTPKNETNRFIKSSLYPV